MVEYRFYLFHKDLGNWTRIEDPIGWESLTKTIKRFGIETSPMSPWHGIFFSYEIKVEFIKKGKNLIQGFFEQYGIEQEILIRIDKRDSITREFLTDYEGKINLSTYEVGTTKVRCNIEQTGFIQKLKNRGNIKVAMDATASLGNKSIAPPSQEPLIMHSKIIRKADKLAPDGIQENTQLSIAPGNYYLSGGLSQLEGEIGDFFNLDIGLSIIDPLTIDKYVYQVKDAGEYNYSGKLRGDITSSGNSNFSVEWFLAHGKQNNYTQISLGTFTNSIPGFVQWHFNITPGSIMLEKGEQIYIYATVSITSIGGDMTSRCLIPDDGGLNNVPFELIADTVYPDTSAQSYLIHECLNQAIQAITDQPSSLYSEHYGRTDNGYLADGAGSMRAIVNGNRLRNILKPVYCSFKELVDTCHSLDGVGFGIERVDGRERVRVEPLNHWYQPKRMMRLMWVLDIQKSVATELYFNEIHGGTDKWENEKIRNLDEVNASREWSAPITQLQGVFNIKPPYITSAYSIEFTRREATEPSKDTRYDNDNFIIRVVRDGGNFAPEKDEAFSSVNGIISPETSYNLQDSPARCLRRHGRLLRASLYKQSNQFIKFMFGKANTSMSSELISEIAPVNENADVLISDLDNPLFVAEIYTVRAKLTYEQRKALEETDPDANENVWGFVEFAKDDKNFKRGYLLEARLIGDSNEVTMKLIRANI